MLDTNVLKELRYRLSRMVPVRTQDRAYRGLIVAIDEINLMIDEYDQHSDAYVALGGTDNIGQ